MPEQVHADQIARKEFSVGFRGFDQHEVRSYLGEVAAELAASHERERLLRDRIVELEAAPPVELDEAALERALGVEATRVIHAAREAAAEIRGNAESAYETARRDADAAVASLREEAERLAAAMLDESRGKADALVAEASSERDRVLDELERQRSTVVAELDALHAARERLVEAYRDVRRSLDDAIRGAVDADRSAVEVLARTPDARVAAAPEPVATPEPAVDAVEPPADAPSAAADAEPERVAPPPPAPAAAAVVETGAADEIVEADPDDDDDRRSSSLRLLRRREPESTSFVPLADDDVESVRIIRPTAAPEHAPATPPPSEPVLVEPAPIAAPDDSDQEPVDDLFARLRADRAEKVARAEAVLADDAPPPAADADAVVLDDDVSVEIGVVDEPAPAPSPDGELLAARDDAIAEAERSLVKSLKRALADEQNEVLDALRRLRGAPTIDALLPDVAVHDARYEAVLNGAGSDAALAGARTGGASAGGPGSVPRDLGHSIASDIRSRVGRAIEEASGDVETLAEAISAAYRQWKTSRAEPLARDAIVASFAAGLYDAADGELRWIVDPAEGGCPDCDDNVLAGPTAKGSPFPTGQLHPPAHAGCRCVVVPAPLTPSS